MSKLVAVDLFCGAGGLSYAFHRAGFHIAAAVERNADAAASYQKSFVDTYSPETKLLNHDVSSPQVTKALALRAKGATIDVVIGGPPCQDFSPATERTKREGHRANLVLEYFRILRLLDPQAFLFENVPGMLTAMRGKYWKFVVNEAQKLGYYICHDILRAERFGVPQRRNRLFVVGTKQSLGPLAFPIGTETPRTVMETIGHLCPLKAGEVGESDPMHRARSHRPKTVEYLATIPEGGAWRDAARVLKCHKDHNGHYDVYGRIKGDSIAPTITGGCTNPSKGRFIHPKQHRGLTVREAALLQTFPPDWIFCGGIESQSLQVGNAVPVKLGEALALTLKALLDPGPCCLSKPHELNPHTREMMPGLLQ
ncbi:DNA cytosine methyltransferase [Polyangium fumosum]|uniref:DNA cytosine methyltransferase n=1 Tax=Polyangium fumosum TaxID=889272 RepID=UPI001478FFB6|nr:DNA cytosine methyltransferase [Polyangium fumosum]